MFYDQEATKEQQPSLNRQTLHKLWRTRGRIYRPFDNVVLGSIYTDVKYADENFLMSDTDLQNEVKEWITTNTFQDFPDDDRELEGVEFPVRI